MNTNKALTVIAAAAALAFGGAAGAAELGLGTAYKLDYGYTQSGNTYTFTYDVSNLAQGAVNTQTGFDGFTIYIPTGANILSYNLPSAPNGSPGIWTAEANAKLDLGGDGSQSMTAPTGYQAFTWWGQYTQAVYEPGSTTHFTITLSNVSVGTSAVGLSTYFGGTTPVGQEYATNQYGNYTTFITQAAAPITAVPEPETYAMMLAGLGLVGFMARRKAKTQA